MIRSAREGIPDDAVNIHASAVVLDGSALLITGAAGSGKTHLALALVEAWHRRDRTAELLADDQVFVMQRAGRLVAQVPPAIAGLAEVRGKGIVSVPHVPTAAVALVVDLGGGAVPDKAGETVTLIGVELPLLHVPVRDTDRSVALVAARIDGA